jgi:hypothetical protein
MMKYLLLFFLILFSFADEHFIISKFDNLNKFYYNHQKVHLKLKTISAKKGKIIIESNYPIEVNTSTDDNITYISDIYFELNNSFPIFNVMLTNDGFVFDSIKIKVKSKIRNLIPPPDFCGVLADDIKVLNPVLMPYDKNNNILYVDILFKNANAKDFEVGKKINFDLKERNKTYSKYVYATLLNNKKNKFVFTYFNLLSNTYKKYSININKFSNDDTTSTQIDLNPIKKTNLYLIDALLGSIIILLFLLFYYYRSILYLLFILLITSLLIYFNWPKPEIILSKGVKVHILPFNNSTVFLIVKYPKKVHVLYEINGYKEVEFNDNKIGWVKDVK